MITDVPHHQSAQKLNIPLFVSRIPAGFPSPADDYLEKHIDLNEHLIEHPASTFLVRVNGDSMVNAGILNGDILVVDRSVRAASGKVIVAILNGEFLVKRFRKQAGKLFLISENPDYEPTEIAEDSDFEVWGVVVHAIHKV